jgi:hypothetical protein
MNILEGIDNSWRWRKKEILSKERIEIRIKIKIDTKSHEFF